jgi:ATP-dependent DNA ligase
VPAKTIKATFTEPMLLLSARTLPEGANWAYELKLDSYRALAINIDGELVRWISKVLHFVSD